MRYRVFDSHVDTLLALREGEDILESCPRIQLDIPRAAASGVTDLVTAVCAEACSDAGKCFRAGISRYRRASADSPVRLYLMLEGCQPLLDAENRDELIQLLDFASLTWNGENRLGGGIGSPSGLKTEGLELARELHDAGVVLDVSHLSDRSREDMLSLGWSVSATHCNCRALCDVPRNLPDADMARIAELGGVIGITMVPDFLGPGASMETAAEHLEHAVSIAGTRNVGFGSDLDGTARLPEGVSDCTFWPRLFELLAGRGWSDEDISAAAGDNWRRVIHEHDNRGGS